MTSLKYLGQTPESVAINGATELGTTITGALPRIGAGLVFLVCAGIGVKLVLAVVRRVLARTLPGDGNGAYRRFAGMGLSVFLWFGVALTFLSIVGLQELAAALGTATGFLALGVSYALKDMVSDVVAGVYLLHDPDFMPGDRVTAAGRTGEVAAIELRKTRLLVDGDTVVVSNGKIDSEWTRHDFDTRSDGV